ncbi:PAS domain-containing protein [Xanthocytophaga agilis]|uniref:PAS domain-containing protein n=1 Tax=Xanthocytophaga agilis TaxID=3048010 RepID=A0AAE3RCT8_9BACT|nr:PAS domain-containing protein [Xanthocytophaga agilis]MDJ1506110.1 PAS domain-containing protein [Xanthocytophaga agilis]
MDAPLDFYSAAFLSQLAQQSSFIVFAFDPDLQQFSYLNPAFEQVFNCSRQQLKLSQLWDLVHPEDRSYVSDIYQQLLNQPATGQQTPDKETSRQEEAIRQPIEFRIQLEDRTIKWLRLLPLSIPVGLDKTNACWVV